MSTSPDLYIEFSRDYASIFFSLTASPTQCSMHSIFFPLFCSEWKFYLLKSSRIRKDIFILEGFFYSLFWSLGLFNWREINFLTYFSNIFITTDFENYWGNRSEKYALLQINLLYKTIQFHQNLLKSQGLLSGALLGLAFFWFLCRCPKNQSFISLESGKSCF